MQTLLPLAADIAARLKDRGQTVAISESSSGGLISAALLAMPGASAIYRGGGVIYTPYAFKGLLHLTKDDLGEIRSATEPYAQLLAGTIREKLRADWGLSETGAAGPTGNFYGDAAGHCCVGLVGPGDQETRVRTLETGLADRVENMRLFALEALNLLRESLD